MGCREAALLLLAWWYGSGLVTRVTQRERVLPRRHTVVHVAVVGNGPSVADAALGRLVDECDVVVRFNNFVLAPSDATGNRTTVHAVTAGNPWSAWHPGTTHIVVDNTPWHAYVPWPRARALRLHAHRLPVSYTHLTLPTICSV